MASHSKGGSNHKAKPKGRKVDRFAKSKDSVAGKLKANRNKKQSQLDKIMGR